MTNTFAVVNKYHTDSDYDPKPTKDIGENHTLYGYDDRGNKVSVELTQNDCVSTGGYCVCREANMDVYTNIEKFPSFSFIPKEHPMTVPMPIVDSSEGSIADRLPDYKSSVFSYSSDGGNSYYPEGYYTVDFSLFNKTDKYLDKRVVYIFTGPSGIGKSYLASKLDCSVSVFETDSCPVLPDVVYADIIVIGKKYGHFLNDISPKLFGQPIVRVAKFS